MRLLYESAMRVGEALSLWVQDVDVATNQLYMYCLAYVLPACAQRGSRILATVEVAPLKQHG